MTVALGSQMNVVGQRSGAVSVLDFVRILIEDPACNVLKSENCFPIITGFIKLEADPSNNLLLNDIEEPIVNAAIIEVQAPTRIP